MRIQVQDQLELPWETLSQQKIDYWSKTDAFKLLVMEIVTDGRK